MEESNFTDPMSLKEIARLVAENEDLRNRNAELDTKVRKFKGMAYYDELTGLKRRQAFDGEVGILFDDIYKEGHLPERRQKLEDIARTEGAEGLVLGLFDIDYFKIVNDNLGHDAGDIVLKMIANTFKSEIRETDIVARWGGEEIIIAFPGATLNGAEAKANIIREKIEKLEFSEYPNLKVTVSGGLAHSSDFDSKNALFKATDRALRDSKNSGRNQVTVYSKNSNQNYF